MMKIIIRGLYNCWDKRTEAETVENLDKFFATTLHGYQEGDVVRVAWTMGDAASSSPTPDYVKDAVAHWLYERAFEKYNADDRPDAQTERSMCLGDCIQIAWDEADIRTYTQRDGEFIQVPNPTAFYKEANV